RGRVEVGGRDRVQPAAAVEVPGEAGDPDQVAGPGDRVVAHHPGAAARARGEAAVGEPDAPFELPRRGLDGLALGRARAGHHRLARVRPAAVRVRPGRVAEDGDL